MANRPALSLRHTAATLMCLSGFGQIAALWLRELTLMALADGLLGTVYLVIGIGLFGHSRFSLFLGIVIPVTACGMLLYIPPQPDQVYNLRMAADVIVALLCAIVLWQVRHHPSV